MENLEQELERVKNLFINEICKKDRTILCKSGTVTEEGSIETTFVGIDGKNQMAISFIDGEKIEEPIAILSMNELYDIYKSIEKQNENEKTKMHRLSHSK